MEIAFARATKARPDRKRLFILPLCPVYGAGACLCLLAAPAVHDAPGALFLAGAVICTATEYLAALWYERGLGVKFWDYSGQRGNLWGRVCLPFSAAWGGLVLCLVYLLHPSIAEAVAKIPDALSWVALPAVATDFFASAYALRKTRDRACLRWYDALRVRTER